MPLPEKTLIARIRRKAMATSKFPPRPIRQALSQGKILSGIGDDCAVLRIGRGRDLLVTTDFSLEGVHFRREWDKAESVGHRSLARGLSDIAAMGGEPIAAFLSLGLPEELSQRWVDRFFDGFVELADRFAVPLAGGDTAQSEDRIVSDVVVIGAVPRGKAILRSGARPGDRIYVTGQLGGAAARLTWLYSKGIGRKIRPPFPDPLPNPRINIGGVLRQKRVATAMIDISDGLSTDLAHICEESGVGAEIFAETVPRATPVGAGSEVDLAFALHGGDDYELLFTAAKTTPVPSVIDRTAVTAIGEITREKKILLVGADQSYKKFEARGWEHFRHFS
ncbi:MAG: thiamine-phosphate kinase [Acidobacteria bacterium]|nr:thiamine-phosphate kinase [Acidobacteriota bacterium]